MSEPRVLVVIPAAGAGTRLGGDVPKQFRPLGGKPILLHVVERFFVDERVTKIVVAVTEGLLGGVKQTERVHFVAGGATRQQSVIHCLDGATATDDFDLIAVHDAVRPFFRTATFHAVLDAAQEHGAALPAIPVTDTIHTVQDWAIAATLDRSTLAAAQTPQCFRAPILREVLDRAAAEKIEGTDEAGLATLFGYRVQVVPGDAMNFKITRPEDLELAAAHFEEWSQP